MRETSCLCAKQLQLFLGSYVSPFTADQHASKLAVLVCSCASTRSHPLPLGKFLAVVCSRYFSLAAVQVSLASYRYCLFSFAFPAPSYEDTLFLFLPGSAASFTLHRFCLTLSLFFSRMLCCPCWGTTHFSTFASDHENSNYARSFSVYRRLRLCFLCCTVCFCSL